MKEIPFNLNLYLFPYFYLSLGSTWENIYSIICKKSRKVNLLREQG